MNIIFFDKALFNSYMTMHNTTHLLHLDAATDSATERKIAVTAWAGSDGCRHL